MYSTFLREPRLLALGYDLEQELHARQQPRLMGHVIPIPNAGLCGDQPGQPAVFTGRATAPAHGRIFQA